MSDKINKIEKKMDEYAGVAEKALYYIVAGVVILVIIGFVIYAGIKFIIG